MISAITMNQVREALCNQYVLTQLSAIQLQHMSNDHRKIRNQRFEIFKTK